MGLHAGHRRWPDRARDNLFKPHSPTPLPALGADYGASHTIRGGEANPGRLSHPGRHSHRSLALGYLIAPL